MGEISKKVQGNKLVFACTIEKRKIMCGQESDGDGGAGKRKRGRPKQRWLDNITNDLSERELSGEEAQYLAKLRRLVSQDASTPHKIGTGHRSRRLDGMLHFVV